MLGKRKLGAAALALCLTAGLFAGCSSGGASSSSGATQKVTLQLKWLPQAQFMGYYVAQQKGYYKAEHLDVTILPGGSDVIPEQQVNNGIANFGVTWTSSLLKYQEKGFGLTLAEQVFQKSAVLLVSKKSAGINSPADLKGKKIANPFGGNEYELYALLAKAGLNKDKDVTLVQQDFTIDQLTSDKVDAAQAMTYNEYGLLLDEGYKESDLNKIDMNDAGVAMLEDNLFVNTDWAKKNKDAVVRFLRASNKGWADACADPDAAAKTVTGVVKDADLKHQTFMAQQVAKLVEPDGFDAAKIGYIDPAALKQTADLGLKYGLLTKAADTAKAADTSYWKEASASK